MTDSPMPRSVVHFEILGENYDRLQQYYRELFDWKIREPSPGIHYAVIDTEDEGHGIGGGIGVPRQENGGAMVTIYVEVEDIHAYLQKACGLGGEVSVPVTTIPGWVTFALFKDPEGNVIGLVSSEVPS